MKLASKFDDNATSVRSSVPLTDEQIRRVAPSIFALEKHVSRSERYTYIPTIEILQGLRAEGFSPFMACQSRARTASKHEYAKHMLRLRHASQVDGEEANEIILLNSHDGSSAYQMLAGVFRFVCANGMVCGDVLSDIRFRHSGNVRDDVIEGACRVLDDFELLDAQKDGMKELPLSDNEQLAFARASLWLRYDPGAGAAPVTERQVLAARRPEDEGNDLWRTLNRVQENMVGGGIRGRTATGRRRTTRRVGAIDSNVRLNRGLWMLAEEMQKLKA